MYHLSASIIQIQWKRHLLKNVCPPPLPPTSLFRISASRPPNSPGYSSNGSPIAIVLKTWVEPSNSLLKRSATI